MRIATVLSSFGAATLVACTAAPTIDLQAERDALMEADRAWYTAYSASEDRAGAFVAQTAEGVTLLPPDAPLAEGQEAVHGVIAMLEGLPGFSVSWIPVAADVGSAGDLGYTRGTYEMRFDGPDGPITTLGKYLTVWKKQADGSWLVTADMFNADAPPSGSM